MGHELHLRADLEGNGMQGIISTRQKCQKCGGKFERGNILRGQFDPDLAGLTCPLCFTHPTRFFIPIFWKHKRWQIRQDKRGTRLESWTIAQQVLDIVRGELRNKTFDVNEYTDNQSNSFSAYWETWADQYKAGTATHDKIDGLFRNHFEPFFGNLHMKDIRKIDIQRFLNKLSTSPRYKADMLVWLKSFFKAALSDEVIDKLPKFPKSPEWQMKIPETLTEQEQQRVLDNIPRQHHPIFYFLIRTGVRISEACALMWDSIDTDRHCFTIERTFSRRRLVNRTKQKRDHVRYLPDDLIEVLQDIPRGIHQTFVFINPDGKGHYTTDSLGKLWKQASEKAGVKILPLKNATRHSWGTQRAVAGFSPEQIADGMGHSNPRMTKNYIGAAVERQKQLYNVATVLQIKKHAS